MFRVTVTTPGAMAIRMGSSAVDGVRRNRGASVLISAQDLLRRLGQPGVKVFDVRGKWGAPAQRDVYQDGHLPGAFFLDWTREFVDQDKPIHLASVAGAEVAQKSFQRLGIDPGDQVVLYDDYHHMLAARMWWAMRYWGFEHVTVLNGGWSYWVSEGLPTTVADSPPPPAGSFKVTNPVDAFRMGLEDFVDQKDSACLFDARGERGYAGTPDDPRSGHIPGAINVPYSYVLDHRSGRFRSAPEIEAVLDTAAPGWRGERVISSCGSGYAGSVLLLALHEVGKPAQLFDGSFSVWRQDPARAVSRP